MCFECCEYEDIVDDMKSFISQVEKDAIEKRTKLLEEAFKHRAKPVINLDDESKNCKICGYDHDFVTEDNENAYKVAHLKVELSQAIEKTNKRWRLKVKKLMKPTKEGKGEYTDFTTSTGSRDTLLQWSYNQALSDLLGDKKV